LTLRRKKKKFLRKFNYETRGELFLPSPPARKMTYLHLPLLLLLALLAHCYSLSGKGVGQRRGERLTEEYLYNL
jgi:hypothetical protein